MNDQPPVREQLPAAAKRLAHTREEQRLELRTLELRITNGEQLQQALEDCAHRLSAIQADERIES